MRKSMWLLSGGLVALATPAIAQQSNTNPQGATATEGATTSAAAVSNTQAPPKTTDADAGTSTNTGDIVVTATRRNEALSDIPLAVSAVTGAQLQNTGANDIRQLNQVSPSLLVSSTSSEAGAAVARIRGIGTVGDNPGLESSVGVFIDGVYRSRTGTGLTELGPIDRIEVLRGPQGTLFGRNTSAGLISIITAKPSFTPSAYGEVTVGNYSLRRLEAGVNAPLSETLAARLDGVYLKRDGFLHDVVSDRRINNRDRWLLRGQLLFKPSDDFSFRLIGDYSKRKEECCGAVFLPASDSVYTGGAIQTQPSTIAAIERGLGGIILDRPYDRQVAITPGRDYKSNVKDYGISGEAVWDLGAAELTSITAYRYNNYIRGQDADFNNLDILYRASDGGSYNKFKTFSQELRLQGSTWNNRLDWLVGGYYANEKLQVRDNLAYGADYSRYANCLVALNFQQATGAPVVSTAAPTCFSNAVSTGLRSALVAQYNAALAAGNLAAAQSLGGTITTLGAFAGLNNTALATGLPSANFGAAPFGLSGYSNLALASGAPGRTLNGVALNDLYNQTSNNFAIFTHNIFTIAPGLKLTAGLRYTREKKTLDVDLRDAGGGLATNLCAFYSGSALGSLQQLPCVIPSLPGGQYVGSDSRTEKKFSGTAVLSYKPTESLLTYISYSRGYKAGGYNLDRSALSRYITLNSSGVPVAGAVCPFSGTVPAACTPGTQGRTGLASLQQLRFKPEINDAFELGAKYNGRGVDINVAVFNQQFRDFQLNTFNGVNFFVENINRCGDSLNGADTDNAQVTPTGACTGGGIKSGVRSRGVEFEAFTRPIRDVNVNFGATYADTKYRSDLVGADGRPLSPALFQLPGRRLSNSSLWTLSGSIAWTPRLTDSGIRALFYVDARHQTTFNTGSDLDLEKLQSPYTQVNARVGIRGPGNAWAVELWAQNLTKENFKQVAFDATLQGSCTIRGAQAGFCSPIPNRATQLYGAFLAEPRTYGLTVRFKWQPGPRPAPVPVAEPAPPPPPRPPATQTCPDGSVILATDACPAPPPPPPPPPPAPERG
ncbi:TonB-dependent receptor [Sphingomonas sp. KRR8]|uniref:TonB-dependent receptor n=1 Tax=Sphingomonas sp. KRR8 TaxID=2942996 RepID=UPI002021F865|nr:TonB-dependent receptor [Sphingomonas sp. KRR8]URD60071.1 TonB-dependent receptor [Sphingomonas sp. KRR8]